MRLLCMSFACLLSASGLDEHDRLDRSDLSALPRNLRALMSFGIGPGPSFNATLLQSAPPLISFGAYSTFALLAVECLVLRAQHH